MKEVEIKTGNGIYERSKHLIPVSTEKITYEKLVNYFK